MVKGSNSGGCVRLIVMSFNPYQSGIISQSFLDLSDFKGGDLKITSKLFYRISLNLRFIWYFLMIISDYIFWQKQHRIDALHLIRQYIICPITGDIFLRYSDMSVTE